MDSALIAQSGHRNTYTSAPLLPLGRELTDELAFPSFVAEMGGRTYIARPSNRLRKKFSVFLSMKWT